MNEGVSTLALNRAQCWIAACSRTGPSHRREAKPCQDANAIWLDAGDDSPCLILAVADGHGDNQHDLSEIGASLAVRSALSELQSLFINIPRASLKQSFKADFPRHLGRRWREAVLNDAQERLGHNPLGLDEQEKLIKRYGTTLLVALASRGCLLLGQLGDGIALLLHEDGRVERPLPGDPNEVGTTTQSLCSRDSHLLWQIAGIENDSGGLLVLATDGFVNAFGNDTELEHFVRSLERRSEEFGVEPVASALPGWLDTLAQASGDDITLAFARTEQAQSSRNTQKTNTREGAYPCHYEAVNE